MQERMRFIQDYRSAVYPMTELCERYEISRRTGYKWAGRFDAEGVSGLEDRSRAPVHCPHRMPASVREALLEARRRHPTWGPRKLLAWLKRRRPAVDWPAASSVGDLLRREGLVPDRRRRPRREPHPGRPQLEARDPNDLWTADYKGHFRTRNRSWCYPLTVLDHVSRRCLALQALPGLEGLGARAVFERTFRECGLPLAILTDNGAPFAATRGLHGLTKLSVWWMRLGIRPLRIEPASPQQNGAHERFHRTLKAETTKTVAADRTVQQRRFNRFRAIYNDERPHEALADATPASRWVASPRPYPARLPGPEYPSQYAKRLVNADGSVYFRGGTRYLTTALKGQRVGFLEVEDGIWAIYFSNTEIARWNEQDRRQQR